MTSTRGKKKKNARRLLDRARGEHLNLKGPKFEVLSRAKEVRCPFYGSAYSGAYLHEKSVLQFLRLHTRHHGGSKDSSHSRKLFSSVYLRNDELFR